MARYKQYNYDQLKLLPISFSRPILSGTFEHTLSYIVDHELNNKWGQTVLTPFN